jgi:hypothetical protein
VQQQQLQQPQPVHQISSQVEQRDRSLHEQALYQMPQPGEPLPPLPRFRPRKVQQQPVPVLRALEVIKVRQVAVPATSWLVCGACTDAVLGLRPADSIRHEAHACSSAVYHNSDFDWLTSSSGSHQCLRCTTPVLPHVHH